jgi:glycosyltransferase involved in cell wall biosynthesis
MHNVYGSTGQKDGGYYDTVIGNYFDPADFPLTEKKDDYFLFIGRMIHRKGAQIAADLCKRLGKRLIMAGQGVRSNENGVLVADGFTIEGNHVEHVGTVDVKQRGDLMSRAQAVLVPTQYIGPFEGVHVEAMMSGTPVITTDWGVFAETVIDGKTGFRCRTMGEMMWAANNVCTLNPKEIRDCAISRWSLDVIRYRYQDYFSQLLDLWNDGWYTESYNPEDKRKHGGFF